MRVVKKIIEIKRGEPIPDGAVWLESYSEYEYLETEQGTILPRLFRVDVFMVEVEE